jgi:hypothetical protein
VALHVPHAVVVVVVVGANPGMELNKPPAATKEASLGCQIRGSRHHHNSGIRSKTIASIMTN